MEEYADKINKLLAKAESTDVEAEAQVFLDKAQEWMTKYSIDEAMLRASKAGSEVVEEIESRTLTYTGGMRKALYPLAHRLSDVSDCKSIRVQNGREIVVRIIGFPKELDRIEMLDTSVKLQCARALKLFVKDHVDPSWHKSIKRNEKREFVIGYVAGVVEKLQKVTDKVVKEATDKEPGVGLVLRSRKDQVDDWYDRAYPHTRMVTQRIQRGSVAAAKRGQAEGRRADIGGSKLGGRRALTA